jgi:tRNA(adenine34) deaminase
MGADWSPRDTELMQAALTDAALARGSDEVPVGAVVVVDGEVVGTGHNATIADSDPSAHAEVVALRAAAQALGNHRLVNATLYVTLEPCVMCVGAIAQARVARVVFGAYDKKAGALGSAEDLSESPALNHRFEVNGGLLADACGELLSEFFAQKRG